MNLDKYENYLMITRCSPSLELLELYQSQKDKETGR